VSLIASSCFSSVGASTALPRTTPPGTGRPRHRDELECVLARADHLARPWSPVEPDGEAPPLFEPGVLETERGELVGAPHSQAVCKPVGAGEPWADPVAEDVEVVHHLTLFATGGDNFLRLEFRPLDFSFSAANADGGEEARRDN